jgi:hypothetical protein
MRSIVSIAIDAALVTATSAYAAWLDTNKDLEPDFTWAEVAAGTTLCLVAAGLQSRVQASDWRAHEREVWRAFALGGAPVVVGELRQWLRRREERRRYRALRQ